MLKSAASSDAVPRSGAQQLSSKAQAGFQRMLKSAASSDAVPRSGAQQLSSKAQAGFQRMLKSAASTAAGSPRGRGNVRRRFSHP
ncbi:MAG TPA: hypothetical protein PK242_08870 [Ottowia sp.]|nr:hypothetical protein [Burkholderiales bacterium]HOZ94171.1 hypothetical protein [Ottowia sp.]HQQ54352.1 hypothetical protein [Ottowia sp.]